MAVLDRDHYERNLLDRVDELETRVAELERMVATALFDGTTLNLPGGLKCDLATEDLEVLDAGSAGATEQDWVEVEVGGNTGYLRVYAAK